MPQQHLYGGVVFPADGPDLLNVAKLDHGARGMIHSMMTRGLQVDLSHFAKMETALVHDMDAITEAVHTITGHYINLDSGPQVSDLLFKKLGLKQARVKMTKSGDRESVENEVLVAIQHDHPVVPKILDFKELSKLKGAYVSPMPGLAKRTQFGQWRMFPKLGDTRVPSGRLNCIAGGTFIEALRDVSQHPKGIAIEDLRAGDYVYSFDENLHLTLKRVRWVSQTGRKDTITVFWRGSGNKHKGNLTLTPDHLVRLTNGRYVKADSLKHGDRICSLSRGLNAYGYARLWATGVGEIRAEHRFVWSALHNWKIPQHVHHKNRNRLDNRKENLVNLHGGRHIQVHMSGRKLSLEHREKLRVAYWLTGLGSKTFEEKSTLQNSHKLHLSREWILDELERYGGHPTQVCRAHGIDYETFQKYMRKYDIDWKEIAKRHKLECNHVVEFILESGYRDVYDLEVVGSDNFIAGEICVHNCKEPNLLAMPNRTKRGREVCEGFITDEGWTILSVDESQIEPRVITHRSKDGELRRIYENEEDIYSDFAVSAFKIKDERYQDAEGWHYPGVDKKRHRFPSKTCILAAFYDVTNVGLLEQMPVVCANCGKEGSDHVTETCPKGFQSLWNENNCQDILNSFYLRYPEVLTMRLRDHARARRFGYLWGEFGRLLHVPAVWSVLDWVVSAALREGGNFPIQDTAQGTVKLTMAAVYDDMVAGHLLEVAHPLLQIHDEILFECREDIADELAAHVGWRFETCVELDIPIKASAAKALTWGALPK